MDDGPTTEQVMQAIRIIDEHLNTCTDDPCLGVNDQLRAIHPDLVRMGDLEDEVEASQE